MMQTGQSVMLRFLSFSFPWLDKYLYKGKIGFKLGYSQQR